MGEQKAHRLAPLLEPSSVAVVGASARVGRPGFHTIRAVRALGFDGPVYPVTPTYDRIEDLECYPTLADVPQAVDLVVVAGTSARMEAQINDALKQGARAILAYANLSELSGADPHIGTRLRDRVREAGVPLAGPYSIGYVNLQKNRAAAWIEPDARHLRRGGIAIIVQSGATYSYALISDPRAGFTLGIHPGQELDLSVADYMDYALADDATRVIGVFLESIRQPEQFRAALQRADQTGVAVVVLHVGRSAAGARHVLSHAGRLAGRTGALDAVFRRYGVFRVDTMEQWWASLLMLGHDRQPRPGGVVAMTDSGGQRALLADHASAIGLPWTRITGETRDRIADSLNPTLEADNPLDFWGGEPDWVERTEHQLRALLDDPGAGIGVVFTDFSATDVDPVPIGLAEICRKVAGDTTVPIVAAQYTARHFYPKAIHLLTEAGIPVLDGGRDALLAINNALRFRDRRARDASVPPGLLTGAERLACRTWMRTHDDIDESTSLRLLERLDLPIITHVVAETLEQSLEAAEAIGYPVALKTAAPGVAHKSERRGVRLALKDAADIESAYRDMHDRLGPRVIVAAMARAGVELSLGMIRDREFGPLVMLGSGGIMIESVGDVVFSLPPFGEHEAVELLASLSIAPRLRGMSGAPAVDERTLCKVISRFSVVAASLADEISELDINPLIAGDWGCIAVDALLVRSNEKEERP